MFKDPKNYLFLINYNPKENFNLIKNIKKTKTFFKTDSKLKKNSLLNIKKEKDSISIKKLLKKKYENISINNNKLKKSIISSQKPKNLSQNQKKKTSDFSTHFDIQTPNLRDGFNIYKRIKERTKNSKNNKIKQKSIQKIVRLTAKTKSLRNKRFSTGVNILSNSINSYTNNTSVKKKRKKRDKSFVSEILSKKKSIFNKSDLRSIKGRNSSTGPNVRKSACLKKYNNEFSNTRSTLKVKSIYGFSR